MEEKQGSFVRVNVIVDSNIVFSSLLLSESTFGDLLLHSDFCFQFHSALHLETEIEKHWTRIVRISKLSETNLEIAKALLFNKISFHSERQISAETCLENFVPCPKMPFEMSGQRNKIDVVFINFPPVASERSRVVGSGCEKRLPSTWL